MESRKVQSTGGSSYVITLPKEWVTLHGIMKNDSLNIATQSDGSLVIIPKAGIEAPDMRKELFVDDVKNQTHLHRLLIGAYITGYSTIVIKAKKRIDPQFRRRIIKFTQTAIGPEIIEETTNTITLKDLLSPTEMPFDKTIQRMHVLVKTMHEDAITALVTKDAALAEDVIKRDDSVDRLVWLVSRQYNMVLRDIALSRKMEVTQDDVIFYLLVARVTERIGDHAVRLAKNILAIQDSRLDKSTVELTKNASDASLAILQQSFDAWRKRTISMANTALEMLSDLVEMTKEINSRALASRATSAMPLGYIAESIRRVGEYGGDIAELTINYLIRE